MADQQTFETFISSERERIGKEREALLARKAEIDTQIAACDRELAAISAYEDVKTGRTAPAPKAAPAGGAGGRRTGRRDAVLSLIKANPNGISPSQVLAQMGAQSDADKTSVRNALSALKRNNAVTTRDGSYFAT